MNKRQPSKNGKNKKGKEFKRGQESYAFAIDGEEDELFSDYDSDDTGAELESDPEDLEDTQINFKRKGKIKSMFTDWALKEMIKYAPGKVVKQFKKHGPYKIKRSEAIKNTPIHRRIVIKPIMKNTATGEM